jgi:hypothetical protein
MTTSEVMEQIVLQCKLHNAQSVILFGSRAKGTNMPRSDFDIAVFVCNFECDIEGICIQFVTQKERDLVYSRLFAFENIVVNVPQSIVNSTTPIYPGATSYSSKTITTLRHHLYKSLCHL